MPKVRLKVSDVEQAYTGKMEAIKDDSGDHIYYYLEYKGSEYTVGKLSHSWKGTLNDTQILMLARKLHLQKREFELWVICDIETPDMIQIWQNRRQSTN